MVQKLVIFTYHEKSISVCPTWEEKSGVTVQLQETGPVYLA
jgi:hypothetical protein